MMLNPKCSVCGSEFYVEKLPNRGAICFKCHVNTVSLGFRYGRDDFHGPTVKERQDKQLSDAKLGGINAEPIGKRWV